MNPFDPNTVELKGSNLVEASAGTGKTYSIAILSLRLLIEENLSIKEILMVTFTNAAVAELEDRIRLFVRKASKAAKGVKIDDDGIAKLIKDSKVPSAEIIRRLEKAKIELDETSILTIHSFCQNTLTEFAFETDQIYGAEPIQDIGELIGEGVNEFWRNNIRGLDKDLLKILLSQKVRLGMDYHKRLSRGVLCSAVQQGLGAKTFAGTSLDLNELPNIIVQHEELMAHAQGLEEHIRSFIGTIKGFTENQANIWIETLSKPQSFWNKLMVSTAQYTPKIFSDEVEMYYEYEETISSGINGIYVNAIKQVQPAIRNHLAENKLVGVDDLIKHIHKAVVEKKNTSLIENLRAKYKAVFIDEFQDTDQLQYEIFSSLFDNSAILFYIGDPKQSIYGWRKADINTYFKASNSVAKKRRYTMTTNYRSANNYVDAMNKFFLPKKKFDTFCYDSKSSQKILYEEVNGIQHDSILMSDEEIIKSLTIYNDYRNQNDIFSDVFDLVHSLLVNGNLNGKQVKPSQVAVLVRSGYEGARIKRGLSNLGIPTISLSDEKVFDSQEARYLSYILETINEISWKGINKALLNPFTGLTSEYLQKLDNEQELNRFKKYAEIWAKQGVYPMLIQYLADYDVQSVLLEKTSIGGDRIISNFYQLAEILQRAESENKYSPSELTRFLKRSMEGFQDDNDEYVQRIESDEEAVKIVTIHKSKGLEYDIVIAPFLDFTIKEKGAFTSFRSANGTYMFCSSGQLRENDDLWAIEQEQENRRLLYVAITRAKYNAFIFKINDGENNTTSLTTFHEEQLLNPAEHVDTSVYEKKPLKPFEKQKHAAKKKIFTPIPSITLSDAHWRKMSYSYLAGEHGYIPKTIKKESYKKGSYDQFIFKDLPKGAHVGNLLHNIFEFIDFSTTDKTTWQNEIDRSLQVFLPQCKNMCRLHLMTMLDEVLNTTIKIGGDSFQLSQISNDQRVNELEFNFNTANFSVADLTSLAEEEPDDYEIHTRKDENIEGLLNGLIDLFFFHNGKYYILDWKSNFLGDVLDDYEQPKLTAAMSESNYHLQYLIYSLAAKKYLKSKLGIEFDYESHFGGVIYLFLRGVRKDNNTGVFLYEPKKEALDKLDLLLRY